MREIGKIKMLDNNPFDLKEADQGLKSDTFQRIIGAIKSFLVNFDI